MNIWQKVIQSLDAAKHWFQSGKAEGALVQVAHLVEDAKPIVEIIEVLVGPSIGRTALKVLAAYDHYAVPISVEITNDPDSMKNALLTLGEKVLEKNHMGVASNILRSAVSLAVTAMSHQ